MDESNSSSSQSKKSSTGMVVGVVGLVIIIGLVGLWFVNRNSINQLSDQLAQTKSQVEDVQKESQEAKMDAVDAMKEGAQNVAGAIDDINNPVVRLALTKAYVNKISSALDTAGKNDLNTIVVFVEKQPVVLTQKQPQLPAEVSQAVANLKTKIAALKTSVATSVSDTTSKIGQGITLQGTLAFVSDDSVFGGSVFTLTTNEGKKYYFEFNQATSTQIKNTMLGKEVAIQIKVTGLSDGHITYDVVSGPTLVTASPAVSASPSGAMAQ